MAAGVNQFVFPSKIGAGLKALEHLPFDLGGFGAAHPLVVCMDSMGTTGGLKSLEQAFKGSGVSFGVYKMAGEPSLEDVREAWTHYSDGGFDAVIAVGGRGVVDVAKCLAVAAGTSPDTLRDLLGRDGLATVTAPLIWVPTMDLTGLETAPEAFIGGRSLHGTALVPDLVVVDPRMLEFYDRRGLAEASLVALAVAISPYEMGTVNPLALPYARLASLQVMEGLEPLLSRPEEATGALARFFKKGDKRQEEVAFVTGMAVAGSLYPEARKTFPFILGDVLAPVSRCTREVLAAVLLPTVLEYSYRFKGVDLSNMLSALGNLDLLCATPVPQRAEVALAMVRQKINRLWLATEADLPRTLKEAGIERETLLGLCDEATAMANGWQRHEVEELLLAAFDGTCPEPRNDSVPAVQEVS